MEFSQRLFLMTLNLTTYDFFRDIISSKFITITKNELKVKNHVKSA